MDVLFSYSNGMKIAAIRKSKNLSQTDLADLIGVEQPTISRLERGSDAVTLRLIKQVAEALDVTVADLFSEDLSEAESAVLRMFRSIPPERQQGWADMALAFSEGRQPAI